MPPSGIAAAAHRLGLTALVEQRPTREQRRSITSLAFPIIGAMASQNLVNLADTAMVGSLGDKALAAVGIGSFVSFVAVAFLMGMSAGVQAMSARWRGAGHAGRIAVPLNGGLLMAAAIGFPLTALLVAATPRFLAALAPDPEVAALGTQYLQVRLLSIAAVGMNFSFRGYWNAVNMSRLYMATLVAMHVVGIAINWTLLFGHFGFPALGVRGAGFGTMASMWVGTLVYMVLAWRHGRREGFLRQLPSRSAMRSMLAISLPSGLQQLLFAAGMLALFAIIARVGTAEVAAANVLVNVTLVAILPSIGFGLAAATLVGHALGARQPDEAWAWAWRVSGVAATLVGLLALPAVLAPELVLMPFLHDPATRELAAWPLRVAALTAPLECVSAVLQNAHLGAGSSRTVLAVSVGTQWALFLPLAWVLGPGMGFGLLAIWNAQVACRILALAMLVRSWQAKAWMQAQAGAAS